MEVWKYRRVMMLKLINIVLFWAALGYELDASTGTTTVKDMHSEILEDSKINFEKMTKQIWDIKERKSSQQCKKFKKKCVKLCNNAKKCKKNKKCKKCCTNCKESVQWSGIQTKIWGDDQCKNVGNFGNFNFGLEDCKKKCLHIATCTAINYNKVRKDCVLRGCTQPVQPPQCQHGNYRGYYQKETTTITSSTPTIPSCPTIPEPTKCPTLTTTTCPTIPTCPSISTGPPPDSLTTTSTTTGCLTAEIRDVTKQEYMFSSPGYSETGYEDNQEYCWRFKAKNKEDKLSISITSINTEYGYDIVSIYEKNENEDKDRILLSVSGIIEPGNIISNKNEIRVLFKTDINKKMKGFQASLTAVKKKDLPHFSWKEFQDGKISVTFSKDSSTPITETIPIKLDPNFKDACVYHGFTDNTTITLASPYSSSNCQYLGQQAQISITSVFFTQSRDGNRERATFAIQNGILQEITEEPFLDNVFVNPPITSSRQEQSPSHIEIRINLAYDRSILDKFKNFGSSDLQIKNQLRQLFYFAKSHLEELSGNTKIKLLLKKEIMFINEIFKVNDKSMQDIRKFQSNSNEPLIVICGDFDEFNAENIDNGYITGLSYRSGACRNNLERYGVGLVAWRENLASAGDALTHEIEHMFGMTHHGHTHHDIANWYQKQGHRCYTETCPSPPARENGEWSCTKNNKMCSLKCSFGFSIGSSTIHCENGQFSSNVEKIVCSPSVFLITGGAWNYNHMEVYHPTDATDRNTSCSNLIPLLKYNWFEHASVFHEGVLTLCNYQYVCVSLDMEAEDPQWNVHPTPYIGYPSAVALNNNLYLFSRWGSYSKIIFTSLPLEGKPHFTEDNNMKYNTQYHCIIQIDDNNVALIGGFIRDTGYVSNSVTVYNLKQQTTSHLSPMITPRYKHACVKVDIGGEPWLVVSGGKSDSATILKKTERLNLAGSNTWEDMEDLILARMDHKMIMAPKDTVIALGGYNGGYTKTIEALNWKTKQWKQLDESLIKGNSHFSVVEVPASLLGCHINDETACPDPPHINHGNWSCNTAKTNCFISCDFGYVSLLKHTTCNGGIWSKVNNIQCKPSVWLTISGQTHSFYHPTLGNQTCSKPLPDTIVQKSNHVTFAYDSHIYTCGGFSSLSQCYSLNLENDDFQWKTHTMSISRHMHTFVILTNKLYFIGGHRDFDREPISTDLPLAEEANFVPIQNLTHVTKWGTYVCVVKLNEHSFVTVWSDGLVSKYDAIQQTETQLDELRPQRNAHACVMVTVSGKEWIVVSGGWNSNYLSTTERLDLSTDTATWENMEAPLNTPRYRHKMILTERGITAIGGWDGNYLYTVEVLNWMTKKWSYVEPSLPKGFDWYSHYIVEVPASTFGCQVMAIEITGCEGEYIYNQEYVGGNVILLGERETCHSVCEEEADCKTWTWNSGDRECRLQTSVGTPQFKNGSVSGLQGSCKPKCFLLLENESASVSTHLCDNKPGSEEKCEAMIQMVPDELKEDNTILMCYKIDGKSLCEEIKYEDVKLLCNDEPSIVTLTTFRRINKHRFLRHLGCYFCRR